MGSGTWTTAKWKTFANTYNIGSGASTASFYSGVSLKPEFNPKNVMRESCASDEHPNPTSIILGLDVTGSMSNVLQVVFERLNDTIGLIYDRKPVTDPQICFAAVGDGFYDDAPLQVTQFESDIRIAEQLKGIWFERGGGGNGGESYSLVWHFATNHTKLDSLEQGRKGFLFTVGDECCLPRVTAEQLQEIFGDKCPEGMTAEESLTQVSRSYEVYHFIVDPVGYQPVHEEWYKLLGKNAIVVEDIAKIPEMIVSILELHAGKSVADVVASWDGSTAVAVQTSLGGLEIPNPDQSVVVLL